PTLPASIGCEVLNVAAAPPPLAANSVNLKRLAGGEWLSWCRVELSPPSMTADLVKLTPCYRPSSSPSRGRTCGSSPSAPFFFAALRLLSRKPTAESATMAAVESTPAMI
ncbi:unnamed protein product, partial [Ectocarpus sp. 12 AP-2014]